MKRVLGVIACAGVVMWVAATPPTLFRTLVGIAALIAAVWFLRRA